MKKLLSNPLEYNTSSDVGGYNCFGFAAQTFEWANLSAWDELDGEDPDIMTEACAEEIVEYSLKTDGPLIRVNSYEEVPIGIEVVGFRIGYDDEVPDEGYDPETGEWQQLDTYHTEYDDYHFIWRDVDGKWWHKPGGTCIVPFTDPLDGRFCWSERYNGEIVWFARNPSDEIQCDWSEFEGTWTDLFYRNEDEDEE